MSSDSAFFLSKVAVTAIDCAGLTEYLVDGLGKVTSNRVARVALGVSAAAVGAAAYYRWVLCLKPSRLPRRLKSTDSALRAKTYPPPYPNGWFPLCTTDEVRRGECKTIEALGRRFAVFRGENGEIGVFDAVCPHNGASLSSGEVVGSNLRCPFHAVEFGTDGSCQHVPWLASESESKQKAAKNSLVAKTWIWEDFHGMLCVWFDAEDRAPQYKLPRVAGIDDGSMRFLGHWEVDRPIEMHLAEFVENTVDVQHFTPMHGQLPLPWTDLRIPGLTVTFDSKVVLGSDAPEVVAEYGPRGDHLLYFLNESYLVICGRHFPSTAAQAEVQFIGPAGLIRFQFIIPDVGRIVLFQTHTPQNEKSGLSQKVCFRWFAERSVPWPLASLVVGEWVSNWWADVTVWEEKIKRDPPSLVRGDGQIQKARAWLKQFYSESSGLMLTKGFDW